METGVQTIRFGILCDGIESLQSWQVECLEALSRVAGCRAVIVLEDATPKPGLSFAGRLKRTASSGLLGWAIFDRLFASKPSAATRKVTEPPAWLCGVPRMACVVARQGKYSEYFSDSDVEQLKGLELDFVIKFGFGIIRGAILDVARYGIWSFHHADAAKYRGGPPGFWEIFSGDVVTGAVLQRLNETLDGGVILKRGYFQTVLHSYTQNRDQAFVGSIAWPAQVCKDLLLGEADYLAHPPRPALAPVYRYPTNSQTLVFVARLAGNWLRRRLEDLLICDMWSVGIANAPVEAVARQGTPFDVQWLGVKPGDQYFADPFGIVVNGELWVLSEDYGYLKGRGLIAGQRISGKAPDNSGWKTWIESPHHMSYPHTFEHEGRIYCLPECAGSGEITLYVADPFPNRWTEAATLVHGFPGVDATLWRHEGRWWLFCTHLDQGPCSHLYIFHSETLTGPYVAHANNPVKIDIRSSRPAGPVFLMDGQWIRPAQNDAITYGGSITLNRIVRLTTRSFREEAVGELLPDPGGAFPTGLHTVQAAGDVTLVDGKRQQIILRVVVRRLLDRISGLLGVS
jgi:hypothetical protein